MQGRLCWVVNTTSYMYKVIIKQFIAGQVNNGFLIKLLTVIYWVNCVKPSGDVYKTANYKPFITTSKSVSNLDQIIKKGTGNQSTDFRNDKTLVG